MQLKCKVENVFLSHDLHIIIYIATNPGLLPGYFFKLCSLQDAFIMQLSLIQMSIHVLQLWFLKYFVFRLMM